MPPSAPALLEAILAQPTAPYREGHVLRTIEAALDAGKVPHFRDPVGNLVVGRASAKDYRKLLSRPGREPLRVYVAHLDHPGFHGVRWRAESELEIQWHGGSPTQHLDGAPVWLGTGDGGFVGQGVLAESKLHESGRALASAVLQAAPGVSRARFPDATGLYGGFRFRAPWWRDGDLIYTKAADDLVGAYAITAMALEIWAGGRATKAERDSFIGLLTRAEEVGFIGTIGHLELGWLARARRPILGVSLETSRTFPGADVGRGPVVRLGDRFTVFDAGALRIFTELAETLLPGGHQRRVMDGGTCEATALTVYGIPCVGISVPLGNYHNQSFQGGPDSRGPDGPAPEFVHLGDVEGMLKLCRALLKSGLPWSAPWRKRRQELKASLGRARAQLKAGP